MAEPGGMWFEGKTESYSGNNQALDEIVFQTENGKRYLVTFHPAINPPVDMETYPKIKVEGEESNLPVGHGFLTDIQRLEATQVFIAENRIV